MASDPRSIVGRKCQVWWKPVRETRSARRRGTKETACERKTFPTLLTSSLTHYVDKGGKLKCTRGLT